MNKLEEMKVAQDERNKKAKLMKKAMYDIANDLVYPVDDKGNILAIHQLIPMLSFHLARCGYRKHEDEAAIVQVPMPPTAGVADDAVKYVPVDARGQTPEAFIRPPGDAPEQPNIDGWHTKTHVTMDGATIKGGNDER